MSIPIRAQLSAVIFEKSMRRKTVKSASKSAKEKDKDGKAGNSNAPADETERADANTKKTEQTGGDKDGDGDDATSQESRQAVINLIGIDATRIADFAFDQFLFLNSVARLAVGTWFLVALLGWIPLGAGFLIWLVILPINTRLAKRYGAANKRLMKVRDQRLAIVSESLQGMRQIKFSALEARWEKRILASREEELKSCWSVFVGSTFLIACWFTTPVALAAVSLSVYAWRNGMLMPSVAFVAVPVFRVLEIAVGNIPTLVTEAIDCWVSIKRVQEYLDGPERTKVTKDNPEIAFENAKIAWPVDDGTNEYERFVLQNVDLTFPKGELSIISGKTGTGKSLLLAAILGEVDVLSGSIYVPDPPTIEERHDYKANRLNWILPNSIAFISQIPWLENISLRDNILFGLPFDEDRYEATIEACALRKDLEILPDGDRTELGANGINISGGQKWRVTLARAVYSRAGILVLDDIFSAVDTQVGRHLLQKCLVSDLCKGRTRILATHHVALVASEARFVVELANGVVAEAGPTSKLVEDGIMAKIKSHQQSHQEISEDEGTTTINPNDAKGVELGGQEERSSVKMVQSKRPQKYVEDETRERGAIKTKVYAMYLRESGGWFWWILLAILFITYQFIALGKSHRTFISSAGAD